MKLLKDFYLTVALIGLMILRLFAPISWFGSIVVAGLLVVWIDTLEKVRIGNLGIIGTAKNRRFAIILTLLGIVGAFLLLLIVSNLVEEIKWLNTAVILDEFTLLALLLCLLQSTIIDLLSGFINSK